MKRILAGFGALALCSTTAFAHREVSRTFRTVANAAGVEYVSIDISVGDVTIRSAAGTQIEVSGRLERDYDGNRSRRRAEEILDDTEIEIEVRGNRATIREKLGPAARRGYARWLRTALDIRITLPAGVNLEVEQRIGELEIDGNFRDLDVDMGIGELTVRLPKRNVKELSARTTIGEVHTDVGDAMFSREGLFAGQTRYINAAGTGMVNVRLRVGELEVRLE